MELAGDEGGGDEGRGGVEGEVEGHLLVEGLHRGRRAAGGGEAAGGEERGRFRSLARAVG